MAYSAEEQYKSQDGQDKWANENVFKGKSRGIFVDLGCYDGVTYSNTWYFERVLNWTGVCVEPNPGGIPSDRDPGWSLEWRAARRLRSHWLGAVRGGVHALIAQRVGR